MENTFTSWVSVIMFFVVKLQKVHFHKDNFIDNEYRVGLGLTYVFKCHESPCNEWVPRCPVRDCHSDSVGRGPRRRVKSESKEIRDRDITACQIEPVNPSVNSR